MIVKAEFRFRLFCAERINMHCGTFVNLALYYATKTFH